MGKTAQPSVNAAAASSWWRSAAALSVNTRLTGLLHINHICLLGNRKPRLHHAWTPHHFQSEAVMKSQTNLLIASQGHVDETSYLEIKLTNDGGHPPSVFTSFVLLTDTICVAVPPGTIEGSVEQYSQSFKLHLSTTCYNSSELLRSQRLLHKAPADGAKCLEGQVTCMVVNQEVRVNPFEEWRPHFLSIQFT